MSYFSNFPLTTYAVNGNVSVIKDIFRRASFLSEYQPYSDLYISHTIADGETAESLAKYYYSNAFYNWVILIFNEIHDPLFGWPMTNLRLERVGNDLYGDNINSVKNYTINGVVVGESKEYNPNVAWVPPENPMPLALDVIPITFYDYLEQKNDANREIRILRKELLGDFVTQFGISINV
jgi:hypothetical protein